MGKAAIVIAVVLLLLVLVSVFGIGGLRRLVSGALSRRGRRGGSRYGGGTRRRPRL